MGRRGETGSNLYEGIEVLSLLRGLTTAASGMLADERLQQMMTNNLANAQTPGFKTSDGALLSFPQQLLQMMNYGAQSGQVIGKMGTGVTFQEGVPYFQQGQLQATGRSLDVGLVDTTPIGTYGAVVGGTGTNGAGQAQSAYGSVQVGANQRLEVAGQPLAVLNAAGQPISGLFAIANPQYKGLALYASDGKPNYDPAGQPSYVFANAAGKVVGAPGQPGFVGAALRIGNQNDMGSHSFYAVAFSSPQVSKGIALTRDGHFDVTANNVLIDANHNDILPVNAAGKPIIGAQIVINPNYQGKTLFAPNGQPVTDSNGQPSYHVVNAQGQIIPGSLGTVNADVTSLSPLGQGEYQVGNSLNPTQVLPQLQTGTGVMKPGQLEQSNVNVTATMTQMLAVMASYEANQRVIRTEDTLLGKAVNDVGHVS
jgi:flagellar hook protein FlgE